VAVACNLGMYCSLGGGLWYSKMVMRKSFLGIWGEAEGSVVWRIASEVFGPSDWRAAEVGNLESGLCEKTSMEIFVAQVEQEERRDILGRGLGMGC
jgi:hypothetical protein